MTERVTRPIAKGRFAMIPEWIMMGTMSSTALKVYGVMSVRWADRDTRTCWPSVETVAEACDLSTQTVQRGIRELQKNGALRVTRRHNSQGRQLTNLYELAGGQRFVDRETPTLLDQQDRPPALPVPPVDNPVDEVEPEGGGGYDQLTPSGVSPVVPKPESEEPESGADPVVPNVPRSTAEPVAVSPTPTTQQIEEVCDRIALKTEMAYPDSGRPVVTRDWVAAMGRVMTRGPLDVSSGPLSAEMISDVTDGVFKYLTVQGSSGFCWARNFRPDQIEKHWGQITREMASARAAQTSQIPEIMEAVRAWGSYATAEQVQSLGPICADMIQLAGGWREICSKPQAAVEATLRLAEAAIMTRADGVR